MEINNINKSKAELTGSKDELLSLIKVMEFVLKELEYEYFTRTSFNENETATLIKTIENSISDNDLQKIQLTNNQIFNLRQNLNEALFGIPVKNYKEVFIISKEKLKLLFEIIDKYGGVYKIWE